MTIDFWLGWAFGICTLGVACGVVMVRRLYRDRRIRDELNIHDGWWS